MTQEEKFLLLQDICARLPYGLYVRVEEFNVSKNEAITEGFVGNYLKDNRCNDYDADDILNELADDCINIKPYLRPMSSMTEDEKNYLSKIGFDVFDDDFDNQASADDIAYIDKDCFNDTLDFLLKHHIDFRGLIEKGLAIEVPKDMYKTK